MLTRGSIPVFMTVSNYLQSGWQQISKK